MRGATAALAIMLLLPTSAMAEQFDLVCTWAVGNLAPVDTTFHVDTDRNIVNGWAAKISDAEIRFEAGKMENGRPLEIVINRYTGSMTASLSGPPQIFDSPGRGKCVKPTQRQF